MAHMAPFAESDFDSIHSSQAFIGDHQVMFTPPLRAKRPSRFASNQSYVLPDIPNTSQIVGTPMPDLPKMQQRTNAPNEIVAAISRLQKQLDHAKQTISELMRERDEYRSEAKALRQLLVQQQQQHQLQQQKAVTKSGNANVIETVEDQLFDMTQHSDADEDLTQQLPTLNLSKPKQGQRAATANQSSGKNVEKRGSLKATTEQVQYSRSGRYGSGVENSRPPLCELHESPNKLERPPQVQRPSKKVTIEEVRDRNDIYQDPTIESVVQPPTRNFTNLSNVPDHQPFAKLRTQIEADRQTRRNMSKSELEAYRQGAEDGRKQEAEFHRQRIQISEKQQVEKQQVEKDQYEEYGRSARASTAPPPSHQPLAGAEDLTAASNTSRRMRHRASDMANYDDDNLTSGYILRDITLSKVVPEAHPPPVEEDQGREQGVREAATLSDEAKNFLHSVDPDHIVSCVHCRRLLKLPEKLQVRKEVGSWDWCVLLNDK